MKKEEENRILRLTRPVVSREKNIYGVLYLPPGTPPEAALPLVVLAHGLGGDHTSMIPYAKSIVKQGYAAYTFDFPGGSVGRNRSSLDNAHMSVMTEAGDVRDILQAAKSWDYVDGNRVVLVGGSQGGMACAVAAASRPETVLGMVLLYPAFSIPDDVHRDFAAKGDIPERIDLFGGWMQVGRMYAEDVWDYSVYEEIGKYPGPVCLIHGDRDALVDISYSQRAAQVYREASLYPIPGAGHEFTEEELVQVLPCMQEFLQGIFAGTKGRA